MPQARWTDVNAEKHARMLGLEQSSLVLTLAYFSLFWHPLREEELLSYTHFCGMPLKVGKAALRTLIRQGILETSGEYICLYGEAALTNIRAERAARANQWEPHVIASIRTLSHLPFLRALLISGSPSRCAQDTDGGIYPFIITAANRLWTARFFAALLCRLMFGSKNRNYCPHYLMAEDHLPIEERTLFSATEVVFLKPALNKNGCKDLFQQNEWIKTFYPNWNPPEETVSTRQRTFLQRLLEWPFSGHLGDIIENRVRGILMKRYARRSLSLHFSHSGPDARISCWECKSHCQNIIQERWHERIDALESQLGIQLTRWPWSVTPKYHGDIPSPHATESGANRKSYELSSEESLRSIGRASTLNVAPHRP